MVYAYEPQPGHINDLSQYIRAEGLTQVISLRNVAIGCEEKLAQFYVNQNNDALSSAKMMTENSSEWHPIDVRFVRLDDESIPEPLTFIKLDLEGGERDALVGASQLILRSRPVIVFENGFEWPAKQFGYDLLDFFSFFEMAGYQLVDFRGTCVTSSALFSWDHLIHELVAIPKSDPRFELILSTIQEFNASFLKVEPAKSWDEIKRRIDNPFSSGFWSSPHPPVSYLRSLDDEIHTLRTKFTEFDRE